MKPNFFSYLSECIGSLLLMFTILATGHVVPISISLALAILIAGPISGGHFNPAVTLTLAVAKKFPLHEVLPYVVSQVAGSLLALELYKLTKLR